MAKGEHTVVAAAICHAFTQPNQRSSMAGLGKLHRGIGCTDEGPGWAEKGGPRLGKTVEGFLECPH